jgi:hypothetical protein
MLNVKFECPFDKSNIFIFEIHSSNKNIILRGNYTFDNQLPFPEFPTKKIRIHFEPCKLRSILKTHVPFYNSLFASKHFSYYFYIKTFSQMQFIRNDYDKWALCLILNQILYQSWYLNENDINHFGGYHFIVFLNKHFENKIIISSDKPTIITFNKNLWCPREGEWGNMNTFESHIMMWLSKTLTLYHPNFLDLINSEKMNEITENYDQELIEVFKIYIQKQNKIKVKIPENIKKSEYFNQYFFKVNNKFYLA